MTLCSVEIFQAGAEVSTLYLRIVLLNLRCVEQRLHAPFVNAGACYVPQFGKGMDILAMAAEKYQGSKPMRQGGACVDKVL